MPPSKQIDSSFILAIRYKQGLFFHDLFHVLFSLLLNEHFLLLHSWFTLMWHFLHMKKEKNIYIISHLYSLVSPICIYVWCIAWHSFMHFFSPNNCSPTHNVYTQTPLSKTFDLAIFFSLKPGKLLVVTKNVLLP